MMSFNDDMISKLHARNIPLYTPLGCILHMNTYQISSHFPSM